MLDDDVGSKRCFLFPWNYWAFFGMGYGRIGQHVIIPLWQQRSASVASCQCELITGISAGDYLIHHCQTSSVAHDIYRESIQVGFYRNFGMIAFDQKIQRADHFHAEVSSGLAVFIRVLTWWIRFRKKKKKRRESREKSNAYSVLTVISSRAYQQQTNPNLGLVSRLFWFPGAIWMVGQFLCVAW